MKILLMVFTLLSIQFAVAQETGGIPTPVDDPVQQNVEPGNSMKAKKSKKIIRPKAVKKIKKTKKAIKKLAQKKKLRK